MKSLHIRWPFGLTWLRAVAGLALFCLLAEALARTPVAASVFPAEAFGSSHPHFNTQVSRILARAAQGPIDCIFLGDSQTLHDLDPAVIEPILSQRLGRPMRCQNFGLGGSTLLSADSIARMLINRFHPSVLILGTSELNFIATDMDSSVNSLVSSPWLESELGQPSLDGWLFENSVLYRRYVGEFERIFQEAPPNREIQPDGHSVLFAEKGTMSVDAQLAYFRDLYQRGVISPLHVEGLRRVLALDSDATRLIVLELPIDPIYFSRNKGLRDLFPEYRSVVEGETQAAGVALWLTQDALPMPPDGWHDLIHLGRGGSTFLSTWVAEQLAGVYLSLPGGSG